MFQSDTDKEIIIQSLLVLGFQHLYQIIVQRPEAIIFTAHVMIQLVDLQSIEGFRQDQAIKRYKNY